MASLIVDEHGERVWAPLAAPLAGSRFSRGTSGKTHPQFGNEALSAEARLHRSSSTIVFFTHIKDVLASELRSDWLVVVVK